MKYVLTGSLGNITKPLAEQLIKAGNAVTIVSSKEERRPSIESMGASAAIGNLTDVDFLISTFTGADVIYTMIPPNMQADNVKLFIRTIGENYAAAIKASGVKKVVNLSSIGAHMAEGCGPVSGIHFSELALDKLPDTDIVHLRPGYFYTNLFASIGMIKHAGIFGNNFGAESIVTFTHPKDIAAVAASYLLHPDFTGKSIRYIVSDERNSKEVTAVLGNAIGKADLPYVAFTDDEALNGMTGAGLTKEMAGNYVEMGQALRSGEMISDYKKHPVALEPTKLEDFAKEFAVAFKNA